MNTGDIIFAKVVEEYCNQEITKLSLIIDDMPDEQKYEMEKAAFVGAMGGIIKVQMFITNYLIEQQKESDNYKKWMETA
jgi:hypothetical protein